MSDDNKERFTEGYREMIEGIKQRSEERINARVKEANEHLTRENDRRYEAAKKKLLGTTPER